MEPKAKKRSTPSKKSKSKPSPKTTSRPTSTKKTSTFPKPVFVLAGEHSGDLLGSDLLKELKKKEPSVRLFGIGGEEMISQGLESMESLENLSVIGFSEIVKKYSFLKSLMDRIVSQIQERGTELAILIDYPGFNLRLAEKLQKIGVKVVFYVSPQIWAWKFKRIFFIRKNVDLMLTLFQFEEDLYREYGVNAFFVGHPLPLRIQESLTQEKSLEVSIQKSKDLVIGLLPGSRKQEIHKLLDVLLDTAERIFLHFQKNNSTKNPLFLLPNINSHQENYILQKIQKKTKKVPGLRIHYSFQSSSQVMESSELLILASGTATLEGVYWEKPMIVLYKVSLFTYFLGAFLLRTKNVGLVNILAGKEICRELIQNECTPSLISKEAIAILEDKKYQKKIVDSITNVKKKELSVHNGAKMAAEKIVEFSEQWKEETRKIQNPK